MITCGCHHSIHRSIPALQNLSLFHNLFSVIKCLKPVFCFSIECFNRPKKQSELNNNNNNNNNNTWTIFMVLSSYSEHSESSPAAAGGARESTLDAGGWTFWLVSSP